ncbi:MAG: CHAT domain-containing protein [Lutibacter sp.]|nr:CHAT domain-containing protein [Lutibacter sp.]
MLKNTTSFFFLFFSIFMVAQKSTPNFDALKQQSNLTEFIYVHLEEFTKNPSAENLAIFENLPNKLWRNPINDRENTAKLYYFINYAYYLKQYGFIDQSIIKYEEAYAFYIKNNLKKFDIIEFCLKPLANNYTRLGDTDRAEDIIKITVEKALDEKRTDQVIAGYSNLSIVFRSKGDYETAINYLEKALNSAISKQVKSRLFSDLAINFLMMGDLQKSEENVVLSNRLNNQNEAEISFRNDKTLASCYIEKNEFDKALPLLESAIKNAIQVFGKNDREVAKIYNQMAEAHKGKNDINKALHFYQKSLSALLPNYHPKTVYENPPSTYFYPENTLKEAFDGRALLFAKVRNYKEAIKNYELAFKVEQALRTSFLTQNAKLAQQKENRNRSENCIDACYELYAQTNNIKWIEKAFYFAELSKSVVLLEAKENDRAKSMLKNDTLFLKERELRFKNARLNKDIVLETLKEEKANVNLLIALTQERNANFNSLQLLKRQINSKYPQLIIPNDSLAVSKNIKQSLLKKDELFMEFFDGNNNVYIFSISKTPPISVVKIEKTQAFIEEVTTFLNLFSDNRGVALQNNVKNYTLLGHNLYKKLIGENVSKNIIIVPDGLFSFLPFDALITKKSNITNFEKLPYLIKKTVISYAYSASILMLESKKTQNHKNKIIGFFPIFENNHRNLSVLSHTFQENKSIENEIKGSFFLKSDASKSAFESLAPNYAVIHLSTHATAGDYFIPPAIEFYDETLYLPEIYGYNLQTDLLVLSACETGLGNLRKGEGAMSLARGFSYAGVKNLIVSLWQVNDKSTEKIMSEFYKNYSKSQNKTASLHSSKLTYLNDKNIASSKKSPYYWAGFVYIGETETISANTFSLCWLMVVIGAIILTAGYFLNKKRRLDSKNVF